MKRLLVAVCLGALTVAAMAVPASGDRGAHPPPVPRWATGEAGPADAFFPTLGRPSVPDGPFEGVDGNLHTAAPPVVPGRRGTVYYGGEMDGACAWGKRFGHAARRLVRLSRVIEASGRRVLFTIGPNKSAVNKSDLPKAENLPHGACDLTGIAQQDAVLDRIDHPAYLPLRRPLARQERRGRSMYWHIDTHWAARSTKMYAQMVAERLDPRVARLQTWARSSQTIYVDLNYIGAVTDVFETQRGPVNTTDVDISPVGDSPPFEPGVRVSPEHVWATSPARRTIRGRTLLLGDSFTYRALDALMPLFRRGTFQWYGLVPQEDTLAALRESDTVVLEVVQRSLPIFMTSNRFRRDVAAALRPGRGGQ